MRINWLLFLLAFLLCACGSSQDPTRFPTGPFPLTLSSRLIAAAGGQLLHPSGHMLEIAPGSLSADSLVSLTLIDSASLSLRNNRDFRPVGTALRLELEPGVRVLAPLRFHLPLPAQDYARHAGYLYLGQGLVVPMEHSYDVEAGRVVIVKDQNLDGVDVTVGLVDESGWLSRPAHVPWSSYNLYVFRQGEFQQVIQQGVAQEAIPAPGSRPLMVVHGLGSTIPRFNPAASYLLDQGGFTQIYGFEYDTLSGLLANGALLEQAYAAIPAASEWSHLAHSMGTLVSRVAFEGGTPAPYTSNRVAFAAGPHLGSPVINALQGNLGLFSRFVRFLVVNEVMDFRNADGSPCQVDVTDPGFSDLAEGSATLQALNQGAASKHPLEVYHTFGGNSPGLEYDAADLILGVYPDDGLVNLSSANPGPLIGAASGAVAPESHSSIVNPGSQSLPQILQVLLP